MTSILRSAQEPTFEKAPPGAFYISGHSISFRPAVAGTRPIFSGTSIAQDDNDSWLNIILPTGNTAGVTGNLRFYNLQIEKYKRYGIWVFGKTEVKNDRLVPATPGLNGNRFEGILIRQIGSLHSGDQVNFGFAGIVLINSRNNVITGNTFEKLENSLM